MLCNITNCGPLKKNVPFVGLILSQKLNFGSKYLYNKRLLACEVTTKVFFFIRGGGTHVCKQKTLMQKE